jgi:hypothetical protein
MNERKRKLSRLELPVCRLFLLLSLSNGDGFAQAKAEMGIAEVNGTKLSYEMKGKGSIVVLIHGGLADSRLWDDQFEAFAKRHRVLRYDPRGFGKSAASCWAFCASASPASKHAG